MLKRTTKINVVIVFSIIIPFILQHNAFADMDLLPKKPVHGKILKVIKGDHNTYVNLKMESGQQWFRLPKVDVKPLQNCTLYMPYLELTEELPKTKIKALVWFSYGIVDTKWPEKQFKFKTTSIGDPFESVIFESKTWGCTVEETTVDPKMFRTLLVKDFNIGDVNFDVELMSDTTYQLESIVFKGTEGANPELQIEHLYRIFLKKYGPPKSSNKYTNNGATTLYRWKFGEINIDVGYQGDEVNQIPFGRITNMSRMYMSLNSVAERIDKLKSKYDNTVEGIKDSMATKGANSY
jgi:hypothetical protein